MGKNKLRKFAELDVMPNVFDYNRIKNGEWNKTFFENDNPITVELACGKGEYTVALAKKYPNRNFIGVDIKGNRLWTGANDALVNNLKNVAFLRIEIERITEFFIPKEISEMWITFPDPQPQDSRIKKRLTSERFTDMYKTLIKDDGILHIKTDSDLFYNYSKEVLTTDWKLLRDEPNVYALPVIDEVLQIKTAYEEIFSKKGFTIKYLCYGR